MQELIPGLYQLSRGANLFLLETAVDEMTLIDTGIPGTTGLVMDVLKSINKEPQDIKHILISHADIDHVGSLAGLVEATGATVYASKESKPYIESARTPPHSILPLSIFMGTIQTIFQKKAQVDKIIKDGDILPIGNGIQVIATPGHTPDHHSFYWRRSGVLFAADLLFTYTGTLSLTAPPISWSMKAAHKSARKVLELKPSIICVGHGKPVNIAQNPADLDALRRQLDGGTTLAPI